MESKSQEFRVGLMAVAALVAVVVMVFQFGEVGGYLRPGKRITILVKDATGLHTEAPVRLNGIRIGQVESLKLLPDHRGVAVDVLIYEEFALPADSRALVTRSLLGDGAIEVVSGKSDVLVDSGDRLIGHSSPNPAEIVTRMEHRLTATLDAFEGTGREWERLAGNLNQMLQSTGPDGRNTMQQSVASLEQFTKTMRTAEQTLAAAGSLISDPQYQEQLRRTLAALPELMNETRTTLQTVNGVVRQVEMTVAQVNTATSPLAAQSSEIVSRLNGSLGHVEAMTRDLAQLSAVANDQQGTVRQLLADPGIYRNLNSASATLSVLLANLKPVISDLQVFSDKVARHPEVLGVRGAVRGSSGVKDSGVVPAGFEQ